jgi:predicted exporter
VTNLRSRRLWPWLALMTTAIAILVLRLNLSFDLAQFLPKPETLTQRVFITQMGGGPASRLVLIGLRGEATDSAVNAGGILREQLAADTLFDGAWNGELPDEFPDLPEPVASWRLLLQDLDYAAPALHSAMQQRLQELALGGGTQLAELVAEDPYFAAIHSLAGLQIQAGDGEPWVTESGLAVVMAQTVANATNLAGQQLAMDAIRSHFAALPGSAALQLEITGAGAFGVELQAVIRADSWRRALMASFALLLVLLIAYRKPAWALMAGAPLACGYLCGLAAVALLYEQVHGITLAFGFTLLGVAIDYPLHLFSHARHGDAVGAMRRIWPTLRLGAVSSLLAYAAFTVTGSQGLAQLGLFTVVGIAVAVGFTRHVLSGLLDTSATARPTAPSSVPPLRTWPVLLVLLGAALWLVLGVAGLPLDNRLSSLSPVPAQQLALDQQLRQAGAAPDMRYQLISHDRDLDQLLERGAQLDEALSAARAQGELESWSSLSQLLPGSTRQTERQARIPDAVNLRQAIAQASEDLPFKADAFEPFVALAQASRDLPPLAPTDFQGTPLASWLDAHLLPLDDGWVSVALLLRPDIDVLRERLAALDDGSMVLDLVAASSELVSDHRHKVLRAVALAVLLILGLLAWQCRGAWHAAWVLITVSGGIAVTLVVLVIVQGALTLFHDIALLLVFGLGLDYALFASRDESAADRKDTLHALGACSASTTLSFAILAGSAIPVLQQLGLTVAVGSASCYLLALLGSSRFRPVAAAGATTG